MSKILKMPFENHTYIVPRDLYSQVCTWLSQYEKHQYVIEQYGLIRLRDSELETLFLLRWL